MSFMAMTRTPALLVTESLGLSAKNGHKLQFW